MDLFSQLESIGPGNPAAYAGRVIPGFGPHFIGRDSAGLPVIFLGSRDSSRGLATPIRLDAIEVQFSVFCRISLPDGASGEHRLSIIRCLSSDPELQKYFIRVAEAIVKLVGPAPAFTQVTGAVRKVIELFRHLSAPARRELIGLYGELLLIVWSASAIDAIRAWRSDPMARFDFSNEETRVDVKATTQRTRAHNFSLDQCSSPPGTCGMIASIMLSSGTGPSVADLIRRVEVRLVNEPDLVMKLHDQVADCLGAGLVEGLRIQYDEKAARSSLRWYLVGDIPAPRGPVDPAVSDVRFRADLTLVAPRSRSDLLSKAPSVLQILPLG